MIHLTGMKTSTIAQAPRLSVAAVLVGLFLGCGAAQPEFEIPDTYPFVQCTIEMSGDPVLDAVVAFHGKDSTAQQISGAFDNDNDCYRFITKSGNSLKGGVPEGTYTVTVKPGRGTKVKIPAKYADPSTSDLKAEIEDGENIFTLELFP